MTFLRLTNTMLAVIRFVAFGLLVFITHRAESTEQIPSGVIIQKATQNEIVFSHTAAPGDVWEKIERYQKLMEFGAEHCRKFGRVSGKTRVHTELGKPLVITVIPCVDSK